MTTVNTIVGDRQDPDTARRLHRLEHRHAVETVYVQPSDLDRRRLRVSTDHGEEIFIALPRDQKLFDGAVLTLDEDRAIVVRASEQRWLRLAPASAEAALQLGYHAGNLHWKVRFEGNQLLVACDGEAGDLLARIEPLIAGGSVSVWGLEP